MTTKNIPAKKTSRSTKKTGKAVGVKRKKSAEIEKPSAARKTSQEERFVRDLLIRGEAVIPAADDSLPPGATHRIVEDNGEDLPTVERERFSLY